MKTSQHSIAVVLLTFVGLASARAQRVEQIVENPNAVQLQELWRLQGSGADRIGYGVGGLGDLNADGADEWCLYYGSLGEWQVYYGSEDALPTEPSWRFRGSPSLTHPVIGDFYGNGEKLIGFNRDVRVEFHWELQVHFFRTEGGMLEEVPSFVYYPEVSYIKDVQAADLDGDGDDELIVARTPDYPEVWIYEGGPDFQVQTPTHVIRDVDSINSNFFMTVRDVDGDSSPDIIVGGDYRTPQRYKIRMLLSTLGSVWSKPGFDRTLERPEGSIGPDWFKISVYDADGDHIDDFHGNVQVGPSQKQGGYLWLSGSGRDARTRPYDSTDWDVFLPSTEYVLDETPLGYIGDSGRRWSSLPLNRKSDGYRYILGAGADGPNGTIDAIAGSAGETMFNVGAPAGDVNGDGWEDVIFGNFNYRSRGGVAVIFAGGPYIPNDDTTTSVEEYPVAGESGGLYVWPNPVVEELHLVWKGNLKRMPARFAVYDLLGRVVAESAVDTWSGGAVWSCTSLSAGAYCLVVYDTTEQVIATMEMIKQ